MTGKIIKVGTPELNRINGTVHYRSVLQTANGCKELWFSVNENHHDLISERSDALVVALLIPAMASQSDIEVDGILSGRLYHALSHSIQCILLEAIPGLSRIQIFARNIQTSPPKASGVITGYSAGIDSYCVLNDHHYNTDNQEYELTHLVYNNVGSHGTGPAADKLFTDRYERLSVSAYRTGLPFFSINSNLGDFYSDFTFLQTHTMRNAAVAFLLQKGIGRFLYASSFSYSEIMDKRGDPMALLDTLLLPELSINALDLIPTGSEYSRVEKTLRVAAIPDSYDSLDVCVRTADNCSACFKCLRTMLTLDIAGKLEHYHNVFDLNKFYDRRDRYLVEVLTSKDPLMREIARFALLNRYEIPLHSRILSRLPVVVKVAKKVRQMVM